MNERPSSIQRTWIAEYSEYFEEISPWKDYDLRPREDCIKLRTNNE
jgi:hypothetical protein